MGCNPSLNDGSTPKQATKVLKSNFNNNKNIFFKIAKTFAENPSITSEEAKCLDYEKRTQVVEKLCQLQKKVKVILWLKNSTKDLVFYTFESKGTDFWNGYRYLYNLEKPSTLMPLCKEEFLENEKARDSCLHQLDVNWYLEHSYYDLNQSN